VLSMRRLAWRSIRAHPTRFVATLLAVVVGTAFLSGALVLRDSLGDALSASADRQLAGVAAAVEGPDDGLVPAEVVDQVASVPEVAGAAGTVDGRVNILDDQGQLAAEGVAGASWIDVPELEPFDVVEGRGPDAAGEVALDARTAADVGVGVGDEVALATASGSATATVVGVVAYGDRERSDPSGDLLVSPDDAFAWLAAGDEGYSAVLATAADGASEDDVVAAIEAVVAPGLEVSTGDEVRDEASGGAAGIANAIGTALQGFAYLALFVSLFIIYNTFSTIVAQRTRELALLRALGATGKQVRRSVWVEALLIGVVASAVGLVVGIALFLALTALVPQFEQLAGDVSLQVGVGAVVQVLVSGTLITLLSALLPAFRAARTRPVEALRSADRDPSGTSVVRAVLGLGLLLLGVAVLVLGTAIEAFLLVVLGTPLLFLGVLVGGPVVAAGFGAAVERLASIGPVSWRLGAQNVRRNPRRAATTANALVIGVFLVVVVTAGGGAVRDYATAELARLGGPDVTVLSEPALPAGYREAVEATEGVEQVAEVTIEAGTTVGGMVVSAVDLGQLDALGLSFTEGDPADLGPGDVTLPALVAGQESLAVGDPIVVTFAGDVERELRLGATTDFSASLVQSVVAAQTALDADPALRPDQLSIITAPGQAAAVEERLGELDTEFSGVAVLPGNFLGQLVGEVFDFLISSVNALLSVAVLIALFGIVNTLVLSITERTHEIGLLRAVGMSRRQLRSAIRVEAVAVSLMGSVLGMAWGLFVAWCLTRTLGFSVPITEMAVILAIGVVLGVVASLLPAHRAARLDVLDAIRQE
jgi:putative ABC transport system permease protein